MNWLILTATLPTQPSGLRVRVWRALKATGAGTLREGVYLLPGHAGTAQALWDLERSIREAGAEAHLLQVPARDEAQAQAFRVLFDRGAQHAELQQAIRQTHQALGASAAAQAKKRLRTLEQQWQALQAIDFFPGPSARRSAEALAALKREMALRLSPGEPSATRAAMARLAIADHQGRTWATRQRPWVDRLATAWLVRRFIDRQARFVWLADAGQCPQDALGFDFDGARFSHVGDKVTFEVVAESFGLLGTAGDGAPQRLAADHALQRLAALVHSIDVGGSAHDEAPGFELVMRGLQACHADDDALLAAALPVFDATYAACAATPAEAAEPATR